MMFHVPEGQIHYDTIMFEHVQTWIFINFH